MSTPNPDATWLAFCLVWAAYAVRALAITLGLRQESVSRGRVVAEWLALYMLVFLVVRAA